MWRALARFNGVFLCVRNPAAARGGHAPANGERDAALCVAGRAASPLLLTHAQPLDHHLEAASDLLGPDGGRDRRLCREKLVVPPTLDRLGYVVLELADGDGAGSR
ncbi:MAG: hypothetical protein DYG92_10555 [Leptolyngbya sp. PLA1]|nr:hypothetical protein [Leptolyngbya sp. PLA1]